jgi:hypothetical protein
VDGAGLDLAYRDAIREVPGLVRDELGVRAACRLQGGGTPARVLLCEDGGGGRVVVKVLRAGAGRVDGHDLGSFMGKPRQIAAVHRDLPGLSPHYVPLIGAWQGPGWGAYAMPWVDGDPPVALLTGNGAAVGEFSRTVRLVFEVLGEYGYAASRSRAPAGYGQAAYPGRVSRRLPLLAQHLDAALTSGGTLRVNGRTIAPVRELLARAQRPGVRLALQPAALWYPVHGDLNLGNLLIRPYRPGQEPGFTVIDPRGITSHFDPVYDAAKALFSLTLFDAAVAGGFAIRQDPGREYTVRLREPAPALAEAALELPGLVASTGFFRELDRTDPLWRGRLLYAHAFHALAESACRLSDQTHRQLPGGASGQAARRELATGLYLSGLLLLDSLLSGPPDPQNHLDAHVACIAEVTQPIGQAAARGHPSPRTAARLRRPPHGGARSLTGAEA